MKCSLKGEVTTNMKKQRFPTPIWRQDFFRGPIHTQHYSTMNRTGTRTIRCLSTNPLALIEQIIYSKGSNTPIVFVC